jgi:hypothetical protein
MTMSVQATLEAITAARHNSSLRFGGMAAYFIAMGFLVNAYLQTKGALLRIETSTTIDPPASLENIAILGAVISAWFLWFEAAITSNIIKIWKNVKENGHHEIAAVYAYRASWFIWVQRVTLPLPYVAIGFAWVALAASPGLALKFTIPAYIATVGLWVIMARIK